MAEASEQDVLFERQRQQIRTFCLTLVDTLALAGGSFKAAAVAAGLVSAAAAVLAQTWERDGLLMVQAYDSLTQIARDELVDLFNQRAGVTGKETKQ